MLITWFRDRRWPLLFLAGVAAVLLVAGAFMLRGQPVSPKPFAAVEPDMHTERIWRIAVDAAGRYAVTASEDKTARVWELASGKLLTVLRVPVGEDHEGKLFAVAVSPDGRMVAVGGWTGPDYAEKNVYLYDRASGQMLGRIGVLANGILHLAFSVDGRFLAVALGEGGIRVFDARPPWREVARDIDYGSRTNSVDFDRRGRLVTTNLDGKLRLYNAAFGRLATREIPGGKQPFFARFSPDGARIAVGFVDSSAVSVVSGENLRPLYEADTRGVGNSELAIATWSTDGDTLYAAGTSELPDGRAAVRFWRQQGRGQMQTLPLANATNTVIDMHALLDGRLVFASQDPAWGVLDVGGGILKGHASPVLDHRGNYDSFRLSASGETVEFLQRHWCAGRWQESLARFDLIERRLEGSTTAQPSLAAPRTAGLPVRDWQDSMTPHLGEQTLELMPYEISRSLAISHDARRFALGTEWQIYLLDAQSRRLWRRPVPGVAWLVNLSKDGRYVVTALADGTLRWYRTQDGSESLALFVHADGERWVLWTPEGFYDAAPGANSLLGYRLNQGHEKEGEFVSAEQLSDVFCRPDLVAARVAGEEAKIAAAVQKVGDVRQMLAAGLAPQLELRSPADSASSGDHDLELHIAERSGGIGRLEIRVNGKATDQRSDTSSSGMYSQRLKLTEGRNVVSAVLYRRDNKLSSSPVQAVVNVAPSGK